MRMPADDTRTLWWRLLGASFLVGALLDLSFGFGVLFAQERLAPVFGLELPIPRVYLDLNGLLLVGLGLIYLLIFYRPRRLAPVAAVATLLRFAGFALFYRDVLSGRADRFFLVIGATEGILAMVHLLLLRLAAGGLVAAILRDQRGAAD
jgi:hypothetical protein